jgi:hypothetical protein
MHRLAIAAIALALAACGQPAQQQAAGCARSATHDVVWSQAGAPDVITTSSQGPTCAQAVVTLVARNADGDPLWAFASTHFDMIAGGVPPEGAPPVTEAQMDTFLSGWAEVTRTTSNTLPQWRQGAATLTESASTFAYDTPFDREAYERLRSLDLPMICYAAAVEGTQCLIIDPATGGPTKMVAYGP